VEGIALSRQSAQDMVQMIRYESLDIFVSKKKKKTVLFPLWLFAEALITAWSCAK